MHRFALPLLFSIACASQAAFAQQPRAFVGGGMIVSSQSTDPICQQGSGCARPALGGTTWGFAADLGWFVGPTLSVGAELSVPQRLETVQQTAIPNERIERRHRDAVVSGVVKVHTPTFGAMRFAVVGGGGLVQESTSSRSTSAPFGSTIFPPFGPETTESSWRFGVVAGADLDVIAGPHFSIAPQLRVHVIDRATNNSLGLASLVWRPAVVARAR